MLRIVLPCYNEEETLPLLLEEIEKTFKTGSRQWQVICVNDGSKDRTLAIMQQCKARGYPLIIKNHKINRGLGKALETGLLASITQTNENDRIAVMDSDMTHRPHQIHDMIKKDVDIVIASRFVKGARIQGVPFYRHFLSIGLRILANMLFRLEVKDVSCGYRLYKSHTLKKMITRYSPLIESSGFDSSLEILIKAKKVGADFAEIPLNLDYSYRGVDSKISIRKTIFQYLLLFGKQFRY